MSSNTASTNDKQAHPSDDTDLKSAVPHHTQSTGGHEETGAEKFVSSGGSGGVPIRTGQGYEAYAHQ